MAIEHWDGLLNDTRLTPTLDEQIERLRAAHGRALRELAAAENALNLALAEQAKSTLPEKSA